MLWHTALKHLMELIVMRNIKILGLGCFALVLAGCQTTPRQYNGIIGYQIESQDNNSATLAYTLAGRVDRKLDEEKLQRACQKVLNNKQIYTLKVLSVNEIPNPAAVSPAQAGIRLGKSHTTFSLSDTPDLNNSEGYATRQALETKPSTLRVVRYTCS